MSTVDRSDELRAAVQRSRRRGWVGQLDEALELIERDPTLAKAVVLDVRRALSGGAVPPVKAHKHEWWYSGTDEQVCTVPGCNAVKKDVDNEPKVTE